MKLAFPCRQQRRIVQARDFQAFTNTGHDIVFGQHRSAPRHVGRGRQDEENLISAMFGVA